jgi:hypothetical protein
MKNNNDFYIYFIMLENRKFYVTDYKTNLLSIEDIKSSSALYGPDWVRINRPLYIIKITPSDDKFTMEDYVIDYMSIEGIKNVRGGPYNNIYISDETEIRILRKLNTIYIPINCGDYVEESDSETSSINTTSTNGYIARAYRWICFKKINNTDSKETFIDV